MHSVKIDGFLSCSFDPKDSDVIKLFRVIAEALDIRLVNVSGAATVVPPQEAAAKIENCSLMIAICTKRSELKNGEHVMPQAVQDEMGIAFGKDVPILMFVEEGVSAVGFKPNFGTYRPFLRSNLTDSEFIADVISDIHQAKLKTLGEDVSLAQAGMDDAFAEYLNHLVELKPEGDDYNWHYSSQKKLVYLESSKRGFPSGVWPTVKAKHLEGVEPAKWELKLISSSRDIKLNSLVEKQTNDCVEVLLKPEPHPEKGDTIEYATYSKSRFINAVWDDEVGEDIFVHLEAGDFECADGLVFIHRARKALIEFRFPASYGLTQDEIHPFVGAYTQRVDYLVPSELSRTKTDWSDFGGNISLKMEIESPLPGHIYGIAWHPKQRTKAKTPTS